ncbi:hypothetical protein [Nocardioides pantholopis]|uniref:hypothetical protein n=1 Tax=Nocardioides pantholopis TaxID=2483798 RepID=UPI0013DD924E|nr:hypothetical protein [Nocardioides pantholopis]
MNDDLTLIHEGLSDDGVFVHPDLAGQFSADDLAAITEQVAASDTPVFVVAWPLATNDAYAGKAADLLTRLHAQHPEPGQYLSTTQFLGSPGYGGIQLEGRQWGLPPAPDGEMDYELLGTVNMTDHETLGAAFRQATELLGTDPAALTRTYEKTVAERNAEYRTEQEATSRPGPGDDPDLTGLLVAALIVTVVGAVVWNRITRWRSRSERRRVKADRPYVLPASAVVRIREARHRELGRTADAEVLALGEAIDDAEIGATDATASWQAALDHYDAAKQVLRRRATGRGEAPDGMAGVLDVVGALVLARRGRQALADARAGRAFTPGPVCFLNPLHDTPTGTHDVESGGRRLQVPLCKACRAALRAGREPETLDVERRGEPVHYFDSGVEPWASTGYGALQPDLVTALHGRR